MLKVLLVEDSTLFRKTFKDALHRRFPSVLIEEAADAEEALEKVTRFLPDVLFADVRLPGESGLELTRMIKKRYPETTVVILTHHDLPEYREAAHNVGADGFISKGSLDLLEVAAFLVSTFSDRQRGDTDNATKT
ncbi:MAG: response regulator transcription factor [Thermodesulfobacteriota bacterium]|nr:response regulator transcription factor [Thermodesulfobacteriota bacterium]